MLMCTAWLVLAGTQVILNVGDMARFGGILFQLAFGSVAMAPGAMALTLTPWGARSTASCLVRPRSPALAAA